MFNKATIQKRISPAVFVLCFLLCSPAIAAPLSFGIEISDFVPTGKEYRDIYGTGKIYGIKAGRQISSRLLHSFNVDYYHREGIPKTYTSKQYNYIRLEGVIIMYDNLSLEDLFSNVAVDDLYFRDTYAEISMVDLSSSVDYSCLRSKSINCFLGGGVGTAFAMEHIGGRLYTLDNSVLTQRSINYSRMCIGLSAKIKMGVGMKITGNTSVNFEYISIYQRAGSFQSASNAFSWLPDTSGNMGGIIKKISINYKF